MTNAPLPAHEFRLAHLFKAVSFTLVGVASFAGLLHLGAALRVLPRPRSTLDMDRTILIHQASSSGEFNGARQIAGRIRDIVFTAGTVRFHVTTDAGPRIMVKLHAQRQSPEFEVGQAVVLTCRSADTILIPKE